jgi:hypothetical protein
MSMATKKSRNKDCRNEGCCKKSVPAKVATRVTGGKVPTTKLTKAQLIRFMAEQLELSPKQISSVLDLLLETASYLRSVCRRRKERSG